MSERRLSSAVARVAVIVLFASFCAALWLQVALASSRISRLESEIRLAIFGINLTAHRVALGWKSIDALEVSSPCIVFSPPKESSSSDVVQVVASFVVRTADPEPRPWNFSVQLAGTNGRKMAVREARYEISPGGETVVGVVFEIETTAIDEVVGASLDARRG